MTEISAVKHAFSLVSTGPNLILLDFIKAKRYNWERRASTIAREVQGGAMKIEAMEYITAMLDAAPVCCFFLDQDLTIKHCNQYALNLFDVDNVETFAKLPLSKLAPEKQPDGTVSTEYIAKMLWRAKGEGVVKAQWAAESLKDKAFLTEITFVPLQYSGKDCFLLYMRELSENPASMMVVNERYKAEKRLRAIFENMPIACHFRDMHSAFLECNQMCVDFFNLKDKKEYKERFFDLSPEYQPCGKTSKQKGEEMRKIALEKGYNRFEWLHIDGNGNDLPAEVTLVSLPWDGEEHLLAIMRDLREVYKLVEVERAVRQRMQLILDSSPLACIIHDKDLNIMEVNQEVVHLFEVEDKQEYIDRFTELSPTYQPDGRLSKEKMKEAVKTASEMGKLKLGWMHKTLGGKPIPCEVAMERVALDEDELIITYIRDLREINHALSLVGHLEKLAYVDPLTGAHNRRYFMEEAEQQLQKSMISGRPFSIVMTDIDFFKSVNDTYGHGVGDEVLKILVARMRGVLRDAVVARYGGEEFVVLLPGVSNEDAAEIAWRMQRNIEASTFRVPAGNSEEDLAIQITSSFGVASKTQRSATIQAILNNADKALYKAKESGRNTVVSCTE